MKLFPEDGPSQFYIESGQKIYQLTPHRYLGRSIQPDLEMSILYLIGHAESKANRRRILVRRQPFSLSSAVSGKSGG